MTEQRTVLIGVTGCIAAYKACEVVRGLQKAGVRVKVVMTRNATRFIDPTTFRTLTREPVAISLFDEPGDPVHHVSLAKEADLLLIAPATANVMAKVAHGVADDLLTTTVLAATSPVLIAPAMNTAMWQAAATRENLDILRRRGFGIIDPDSGYLACGDTGAGKLAPVETIVGRVLDALDTRHDLSGKKVLITAGPTYEAIDPVRFIGNRSSGLTGYELARVACRRGAETVLVSGPTALDPPPGVTVRQVVSAEEMLQAAESEFASSDIAIFSAAVCDFRPRQVAPDKIKKDGSGELVLDLVENPDIIAQLASVKGPRFVVGFAAETEDVLGHAREKLVRKHADLIVANDVSGALGFGTPENRVWFVDGSGVEDLGVLSKTEIAERILDIALVGRL